MIESIREQFPILHQNVNGKPLVYLDNAASTQKPLVVIDAISNYYKNYNSNIHRGAHFLAAKATDAYENARQTIATHLNTSIETVNFVRGTTEAMNLVANTWGQENIAEGDEIIISGLEHHSNIVPWQMLVQRKKAIIKIIPVLEDGSLDMSVYQSLLNNRTKLVAVNYVSNALGTINPVKKMVSMAHAIGAKVVVDGAQSTTHFKVDVQDIDCDFYAFSGHKLYGPTGIGVLYGKKELLEAMPPYHGGGEMIKDVSYQTFTTNDLPYKFEAGTPNICGTIALGRAVDFINEIGLEAIQNYESSLTEYGSTQLAKIDGLKMYGTSDKTSVFSFEIEGVHSYDLGVLLDKQGIAVRTGHHCCQPLMNHFGIEGTCRASLAIYNTEEDIVTLVKGIQKAKSMLL